MAGDAPARGSPAAWLVLGIPLATIAAGAWTLWLATGPGATDATPDRVRRTAQVQEAALDADAVAAREGLAAVVRVGPDGLVVALSPAPGTHAPRLQLVHPIRAGADRVLPLSPGPSGWRSDATFAGDVSWHLRLVAPDGRWRLVGRYRPGDAEVALRPALDASP